MKGWGTVQKARLSNSGKRVPVIEVPAVPEDVLENGGGEHEYYVQFLPDGYEFTGEGVTIDGIETLGVKKKRKQRPSMGKQRRGF